jgi:hypothetical protein
MVVPGAGALGLALTVAAAIDFFLIVVAVPLWLVPSIAYLVTSRSSVETPRVAVTGLVVGSLVLTIGSVLSFFLTHDPRCTLLVRSEGRIVYQEQHPCDPSNSGRLGTEVIAWQGSDDTIAWHESTLSLLLSAGVIALALTSGTRLKPSHRLNQPSG